MIDQTTLLNWLGGALIGVLVWIGLGIFRRLDKIDHEQEKVKSFIADQIAALKELYHGMDARVIRLEERDKLVMPRPARSTDSPTGD